MEMDSCVVAKVCSKAGVKNMKFSGFFLDIYIYLT
jgi:hypothetical protein